MFWRHAFGLFSVHHAYLCWPTYECFLLNSFRITLWSIFCRFLNINFIDDEKLLCMDNSLIQYLWGMFCTCVCFISSGCKLRAPVYKPVVWFSPIIIKSSVIGFSIMSDKMNGTINACYLVWLKKWILHNFETLQHAAWIMQCKLLFLAY